MSQNQGNTKQRLIEAAVQLFSRQSYRGTNTHDLARVADVNEASLFRHFSKEDLFWAALRSRLQQVRLGKELLEGLSRVDRPEQVLPLIFEFLVHTAVFQFELIRLLNVGFLELRPGTERLYREHFAPVFCAIHKYLAECSKNGWLRSIDPSITTTAIVATVFAHQSMYPLLADSSTPYANPKEAVSAYSNYWLSVLLPETEPKDLSSKVVNAGTPSIPRVSDKPRLST
jgi:AcrR family transcriptional regulator